LNRQKEGATPLGDITYETNLGGVDWGRMKALVAADDFDNGRTPEQLRESFGNSHVAVVAYDGTDIVGTARALSDGVCNAYVVDVWTYTPYRKRGIARAMLEVLESRLRGQHVYLFTDDAVDFYRKSGFREKSTGMGKVVGEWLRSES
jgi:GNAT superfamily N-acetyltransferase